VQWYREDIDYRKEIVMTRRDTSSACHAIQKRPGLHSAYIHMLMGTLFVSMLMQDMLSIISLLP
jgi:hypothetical protein